MEKSIPEISTRVKVGLAIRALAASVFLFFSIPGNLNAATATTTKKAIPDMTGISSETSASEDSSAKESGVPMMPLYRKGLEAYKAKKYEKAAQYFKSALEIDDPNTQSKYYAEANAMLGVIYEYYLKDSGHLETAIHYYRQALRIEPINYVANKHLAPLEIQLNKTREQAQASMTPVVLQAQPEAPTAVVAETPTAAAAAAPIEKTKSGLGLGAGWSYVGAKYRFNSSFGSEFRYAYGEGINVFAGRGYWSFLKFGDVSVFTGLEGGYITFDTMNVDNTMKVAGDGFEISPFVGGEYFFFNRFSFLFDFSPAFINLTSGSVNMGGVQWVVNGAVYLYPF